ncbi:Methylthioribose-1-phosphate isomerase, partial [Rhypophila decipiens]
MKCLNVAPDARVERVKLQKFGLNSSDLECYKLTDISQSPSSTPLLQHHCSRVSLHRKMATLEAIKYSRGKLLVLDQLRLPHEHHYDEISTAEEAFDCIRSMRVRGAPAIAIVAALAHAVELHNGSCTANTPEEIITHIDSRLDYLKESRPTAVDLSNAINLLKSAVRAAQIEGKKHPEARDAILSAYITAAERILERDLKTNKAIGAFGASWLQQQYDATSERPISVLTHCNTGSLATSGHGTALGIIRSLHENGLLKHAYCTETRPYNQGSRLTSFELVFEGIPSTLITDSMAGALFNLHREHMNIGAVIVGADRVVRNGDTANKIGTYSLAVLARHHGVKFVVAAPTTSIDLETETGKGIKIEERKAEELTQISGAVVNSDGSIDTKRSVRVAIADQRIGVWNPAFDVTPNELIDAIVTEKGTVVKGADGKFDFSVVMPERWAAIVDSKA